MSKERTLVLLKPDAVQRGLIGAIIGRLESRGLKIVGMKMLRMDEALARRHYAVHEGKPFFQGLVQFITSGPIVALALEGKGAVEAVRQMMGATDPLKSPPGSIRGDWGLDMQKNLIHGSDSPETARKELALFFDSAELLDYEKAQDPWVTGS